MSIRSVETVFKCIKDHYCYVSNMSMRLRKELRWSTMHFNFSSAVNTYGISYLHSHDNVSSLWKRVYPRLWSNHDLANWSDATLIIDIKRGWSLVDICIYQHYVSFHHIIVKWPKYLLRNTERNIIIISVTCLKSVTMEVKMTYGQLFNYLQQEAIHIAGLLLPCNRHERHFH